MLPGPSILLLLLLLLLRLRQVCRVVERQSAAILSTFQTEMCFSN